MWRVYYVWYLFYAGYMLTIFRRHLSSCKHSSKGRKYRSCPCPISVEGTLRGERIRKSLDLRNWEAARAVLQFMCTIRDCERWLLLEEKATQLLRFRCIAIGELLYPGGGLRRRERRFLVSHPSLILELYLIGVLEMRPRPGPQGASNSHSFRGLFGDKVAFLD
jgi:hypothetical protein